MFTNRGCTYSTQVPPIHCQVNTKPKRGCTLTLLHISVKCLAYQNGLSTCSALVLPFLYQYTIVINVPLSNYWFLSPRTTCCEEDIALLLCVSVYVCVSISAL